METDPYLPPTAALADVTGHGPPPRLWNPNAAANWSLIFSPAFGAFLHMKNWQALGDAQRARTNRNWVIAVLVLMFGSLLLGLLLPESKAIDAGSRLLGLGMLVSWYVSSAKVQAKLVKERFGKDYPRRGWAVPILATIGCFVALVVVFALLYALFGAG
jgi:hypothetical protein